MASMTKMMTLLLIMENIEKGNLKWDEMVTTSEHAASMGESATAFINRAIDEAMERDKEK